MIFNTVSEILDIIEKRRLNKNGIVEFKKYMDPYIKKKELKCIHIAGTNGKGSTLHYCAKILEAHGYKVGTLSSPALITHLDRIQINGKDINEEKFIAYANEYYNSWIENGLSMFEIDVFLAYRYFQDENVDYAIFEVGLGGEKDATNVITPLVCAITNIGMDHMQLLGNTYEEITYAKAGIIKEKIPLFTMETKSQCIAIIKSECEKKQAPYHQVKTCAIHKNEKGLLLNVDDTLIQLRTHALYQAHNVCLAIEMMKYVLQDFSLLKMKEGLEFALWKGRFEVLNEDPYVIVDGAHNLDGIYALCETLKTFDKMTIVFSALKDKNFKEMIEVIRPYAKKLIICENSSERSLHKIDYASMDICFEQDFRKVLMDLIKKKENVLLTGSLYFVSDVRAFMKTK